MIKTVCRLSRRASISEMTRLTLLHLRAQSASVCSAWKQFFLQWSCLVAKHEDRLRLLAVLEFSIQHQLVPPESSVITDDSYSTFGDSGDNMWLCILGADRSVVHWASASLLKHDCARLHILDFTGSQWEAGQEGSTTISGSPSFSGSAVRRM